MWFFQSKHMNDFSIIKTQDVWKSYKSDGVKTQALRGITFDIKKGSFTSIIGPSGSGKSTLLNIIGFLDLPDKGSVFLEGQDTSLFSFTKLAQIRGKKIGFVFQQFNLINHLSALENVALPIILQGADENDAKERAASLLTSMGLKDRLKNRPSQLSGGEQQRVAIARALANDPEIILADEPTGNLDSKTGKLVMEIFKKLHQSGEKTIIIITHDSNIASYSKERIVIEDGMVASNHLANEKLLWKKY